MFALDNIIRKAVQTAITILVPGIVTIISRQSSLNWYLQRRCVCILLLYCGIINQAVSDLHISDVQSVCRRLKSVTSHSSLKKKRNANMGLMCAIRAEASLQPGLGERPRRSGRRGRRRRATATFHPPEPRPPSRCQRRHRGDLRGQHSQLHSVTRVPQRAAARQHGAGPDEAGDQQVSSVISVSFFQFIPMGEKHLHRSTPGCFTS